MGSRRYEISGVGFTVLFFAAFSQQAWGGSHTWDVNEVFSNADGTIQFVELREANGTPGETALNNKHLTSLVTGNDFVIIGNVAPPTTNRHFLIATQSFADLPGAPTPDRIFPAGMIPFFASGGDTVTYVPWDAWTFGAVPTDGINSMNRIGGVAVNSPTNYAGATGSVDAGGVPGDFDGDGDVDLTDYAHFADCLAGPNASPSPVLPGVTTPDCLSAFDFGGDADVDTEDFQSLQIGFTGL